MLGAESSFPWIGKGFVQMAWVVEDIDAAMEQWLRVAGVGPFFVNRHVKVKDCIYRGQRDGDNDHSSALASAGQIQIELVQQHDDAPSIYRDSFPAGTGGFHHIARFVEDFPSAVAQYSSDGFEMAFEGSFGDTNFCFFDTRKTFGCMTELLEARPAMVSLFAHISNAGLEWDGNDPIRPMSSALESA